MRDLLQSWCRRAGLDTRIEQSIGGHKADVVAYGWGECRSQCLVIDVTVNSALAPSIAGHFRAADMELQKSQEDLARHCQARSDVYFFSPFAIEVHGRAGPMTLALLRQLSSLIADSLGATIGTSDVTASLYVALSRTLVITEDALIARAVSEQFDVPLSCPPSQLQEPDPLLFLSVPVDPGVATLPFTDSDFLEDLPG